MRTKTLIVTAAALAAGLASSVAQSNVYSVNVVGYVNQTLPANTLVAVGNPLDNGTNTLDSCLGSVPAKSTAQFWTGSGFTTSTKGTTWSPNTAIPPGLGFFVNSKTAFTNTYVGNVACNVGASTTNNLAANVLVMVASTLPYAGDLNDTNINLLPVPAKSTAQFWTGSGYTTSTKGATWSPAIAIAVGQGFFINSKSAHSWIQTLPAN
jgi:hypothetical protein